MSGSRKRRWLGLFVVYYSINLGILGCPTSQPTSQPFRDVEKSVVKDILGLGCRYEVLGMCLVI